ncbi:hypothetical protein HG536_0A00930 [Torulaspora globosa]|uniref:Uncharacterized protein n=1 Tax=Torulaspora globosa TaxID=48254 RepID=A0A7G3Z9U0_9SACH|nr:uncharacterized protein HG536_0A00930 [Torulaspora globosa]QLL30276.1 hypothetical protein HG536_0A00930 [Torulaspora globosa]
MDNSCFERLCEQEQALHENYRHLNSVFRVLHELTDTSKDESAQMDTLESLSDEYSSLVASSVDLRFSKYQARESQVAALQRTRRNSNYARLQSVENLAEFITLLENISRNYLTYVNLLKRLSIDLVKEIEIADPSVTEFVVDKWNPPKSLQPILEDLGDCNTDPQAAVARLDGYLDQIKMERAKYTIENRHSLQGILRDLNKEVSDWRKEWDSIENWMFGDSAHSMKKMLQNIDSLKSKLQRQERLENGTDSQVANAS